MSRRRAATARPEWALSQERRAHDVEAASRSVAYHHRKIDGARARKSIPRRALVRAGDSQPRRRPSRPRLRSFFMKIRNVALLVLGAVAIAPVFSSPKAHAQGISIPTSFPTTL